MSTNPKATRTRTERVATRREIRKALRKVRLSREEELVLRMRYGVPEPRTASLEYRGQNDPELAVKLALIEADILARMRPRPVPDEPLEGAALKSAIIDELRRI